MSRISPKLLPTVSSTAKKEGNGFLTLANYYEGLLKEPLLIRATLGTPYIPAPEERDGSMPIDGILSWAVIVDFPTPVTFAQTGSVIPLPLEMLWMSPEGLPLWAASSLAPQGDLIRSREYWHKRYPSDRIDLAERKNANTSAGRWKEYRIPIQTIRSAELRGMAIGHRETIEYLLAQVTHVGKKSNQGFGRVLKWQISPIHESIETVRRSILCSRPVPAEYLASLPPGKLIWGDFTMRMGWTPPYWFIPWHAPCREAKIDFFAAVEEL